MAISKDSSVLLSDLNYYYTSFNTFINNYADGVINTLVVPTDHQYV